MRAYERKMGWHHSFPLATLDAVLFIAFNGVKCPALEIITRNYYQISKADQQRKQEQMVAEVEIAGGLGVLKKPTLLGARMSKALSEIPSAESLPVAASAGVILNGRYLPPPEDKDGKIWVRTSALIQADPQDLYRMWRDVETAPLWQEQIEEVTRTGEMTSHWVMRSGAKDKDKDKDKDKGKTIEWDSEVLRDEPGRRIAWRSIGGESDNAGEVVFEPSPGERGTMVTVLQEFRMGKLTRAWETTVGRNPKQAVIENLRHFKALAETGEIPRTQGQPHGPRGTIAGIKKSMYGEETTTPSRLNRKAG
jgi:uncharacterized membrane protein